MLIVMAGLPGSGKSTVAEELAKSLRCALLSVDPIEAAMWRAGVERSQPTGLAAYVVAEDLARAQLLIGNDVVVDAVNDVEEARNQWKSLAAALSTPLAFIEVFCSDAATHRHRLQKRRRGIAGFPEPSWASALARQDRFQHWSDARLRLDSMRPLHENVAVAAAFVENSRKAGAAPQAGGQLRPVPVRALRDPEA
jgi:predicted kinase